MTEKNQGEGNREAARKHNEAATRHAKEGDVRKEAEKSPEKNQGEGNREAARKYNEAATRHAKEGDVRKEAKEAEKALEKNPGPLKQAEEKGKAAAKEEDPRLKPRK